MRRTFKGTNAFNGRGLDSGKHSAMSDTTTLQSRVGNAEDAEFVYVNSLSASAFDEFDVGLLINFHEMKLVDGACIGSR